MAPTNPLEQGIPKALVYECAWNMLEFMRNHPLQGEGLERACRERAAYSPYHGHNITLDLSDDTTFEECRISYASGVGEVLLALINRKTGSAEMIVNSNEQIPCYKIQGEPNNRGHMRQCRTLETRGVAGVMNELKRLAELV